MPLVIGHRGASGHCPEHTLEAYRLAAELGADCIEPDLVSTADGVLVARHENEIGASTDVASRSEFAGRRTTKVIDGATVAGWFTEDFTYEELRTLRARERIPEVRPANARYDGRFMVPTFREVVALAAELSVGIYPETKHPAHFRSLGLGLEEPLLRDLEGFAGPVFLQSFDPDSLRRMRRSPATLVQLLRTGYRVSASDIAAYADGIGPAKELVIPRRPDGSLGTPTTLVEEAHAAGLVVHPYTFRRERGFLPSDVADMAGELRAYLAAGIDGYFTDNPEVRA